MSDSCCQNAEVPSKLKDLVCGMTVTTASNHTCSLNGVSYYFCSSGCKEKFISSPNKYLDKHSSDTVTATLAAGVIYTCPMHPQIEQDHPGPCPLCGMSLEPLMPQLVEEEEENPELWAQYVTERKGARVLRLKGE